jgi:hypothetical protein
LSTRSLLAGRPTVQQTSVDENGRGCRGRNQEVVQRNLARAHVSAVCQEVRKAAGSLLGAGGNMD